RPYAGGEDSDKSIPVVHRQPDLAHALTVRWSPEIGSRSRRQEILLERTPEEGMHRPFCERALAGLLAPGRPADLIGWYGPSKVLRSISACSGWPRRAG